MFDFGIGASELLFIAIVALIVVGPKDLPRLLRTIGQYSRKIRGLAREFQTHLDEASKEAGLDDVKKEVKGMTNFTVTSDLDKQGKDIKRAIEDTAPKASGSKATGDGKATSAVENAIAESEAAKPNAETAAAADKPKSDTAKAEKPKSGTAKTSNAKTNSAKTNSAKTNNAKAGTSKADTGKTATPKAAAKPPAKPRTAAKAKPESGRSHETVKS